MFQSAANEDKPAGDILLVIFIHGFKGTDSTFGGFPARLEHVLKQTISSVSQVECIVFPAYETKGDLKEAVVALADWLTTLTVTKEVSSGKGAGSAKLVLCGHSMGGLLSADVFLEFFNSRPDTSAPLWPRIIACIAFDTPYLGIHPHVIKNSAAKAVSTVQNLTSGLLGSFAAFGATSKPNPELIDGNKRIKGPAQQPTPSSWGNLNWGTALAAGGALIGAAAAGTAYYNREDLGQGYSWATSHLKYVGNLWDEAAMKRRVEIMVKADATDGVLFRVFYTELPPMPPQHLTPRTFILLPSASAKSAPHFIPARNGVASDEITAHTGMFGANSNDGYYSMGLDFASLVRESVDRTTDVVDVDDAEAQFATVNAMNEHSAKTSPLQEVVDPSIQLS